MTLGEYPAHTLSEARLWREQCRALLAHGRSPAAANQAEKAVQAPEHPPSARQGRPARDRRQAGGRGHDPRHSRDHRRREGARRRSDGAADPQCHQAALCLRDRTRQDPVQPGRRDRGAVHRHREEPRRRALASRGARNLPAIITRGFALFGPQMRPRRSCREIDTSKTELQRVCRRSAAYPSSA